MIPPKLACPNLFTNPKTLRSFALDHGFQGIDWTLRSEDLPRSRAEEGRLLHLPVQLAPLDVRYHLFFPETELGDIDPSRAASAAETYCSALDLVSKLRGRFTTVHLGLGRNSMEGVSWDKTLGGLHDLAALGRSMGVGVCLENLIRGWTARPNVYEKLLRKTGCWSAFDVGHARVCDAVTSGAYGLDDFALAHPTRVVNAHIYHEEDEEGHIPPACSADLDERLGLLSDLPLCDWWVLELREEAALLQTLDVVKEFLERDAMRAAV